MKRYLLFLFWLLGLPALMAQPLESYLAAGFAENRQLKATEMSYATALHAVEEAKRQRSIQLDFLPTYTLAAGGRTIDIPVGDLLNPVYGSLNQLTGSEQFPQIGNASELLNPHNFYDVKVRASYPIINASIGINEEIKGLEASVARYGVEQSRQQLRAAIAGAYYDVHAARQAVAIYEAATQLVRENIRVNQGLFQNGKALRIDVQAARNDSLQLQKEIDNARIEQARATAYLNFLANLPLEQPMVAGEELDKLPFLSNLEQQTRPELQQLQELERINGQLESLALTSRRPELSAFVDLGLQDFDFNVDGQSPYVLAGISLNLNLYDGGKTKARVQLAEAKTAEVAARRASVQREIELEQYLARQQFEATVNSFYAAEQTILLREQQYRDQLKRDQSGSVNYIQVQDSRNQLIQARLQLNLLRFQAWKEAAEYQRTIGTPIQ